jgi:hypothetical protein
MDLENKITGVIERVPCGMCRSCRLQKASDWATRCHHEAQLYDKNSFITLTYAPEHLPSDYSVHKKHLVQFIKRLRKSLNYKGVYPQYDDAMRLQYYKRYGMCHKPNQVKVEKWIKEKLRFYACGEYGEKFSRPHYHAILFNVDFEDKVLLRGPSWKRLRKHFTTGNTHALYRSPTLEKIWTYGYSTIGEVTFESAGYVARYVQKKVTGDIDVQADHYNGRQPEFALMSRRPGIGHDWLYKYFNDVYPKDYCHINGAKKRPPRYYDSLLEIIDPLMYAEVKTERRKKEQLEDGKRLHEKAYHKKLVTKTLKRNYENDDPRPQL